MRNLYEAYQQVRLQESLDKPYHLNDVTADNPMMVTMVERSGGNNVKLYQPDDHPTHKFIEFDKDGAKEIHHAIIDGYRQITGKNITAGVVPTKFVSTMFHLIKQHVDAGHRVRVLATDDHVNQFKRIGSLLANRYGYTISEPNYHSHHPIGGKLTEFYITRT